MATSPESALVENDLQSRIAPSVIAALYALVLVKQNSKKRGASESLPSPILRPGKSDKDPSTASLFLFQRRAIFPKDRSTEQATRESSQIRLNHLLYQ
ncbi:MAG: hypothetical protein M1339_01770, partial [Bacteroidetes bacterium]|nr:hypothetical protein [Bacteroidota bacterium]